MPPLAHKLTRYLVANGLPLRGQITGETSLLSLQFFDVSEVEEEISHLARDLERRNPPKAERLAFMPFPCVWIEWRVSAEYVPVERVGLILREDSNGFAHMTTVRQPRGGGNVNLTEEFDLPLFSSGKRLNEFIRLADGPVRGGLHWMAFDALAIINNPRIFDRTTHAPHRGTQKALQRNRIYANCDMPRWTEIKLSVRASSGEGSKTEKLTGKKAQHFVRSHLRIRLGKLEIVSAHLRGDPTLGSLKAVYKPESFAQGGTVTYVD